jgi:hypothetical protein
LLRSIVPPVSGSFNDATIGKSFALAHAREFRLDSRQDIAAN